MLNLSKITIRSFRVRLAVLSTVLAGTALLGFSAIAWRLIYGAKVSRLEAKIEVALRRLAIPRPMPADFWEMAASELPTQLNLTSETAIALKVMGDGGQLLYQSPNWQREFERFSSLKPISSLTVVPRRNRPLPPPEITPRWQTQHTSTGNWRIATVSLPFRQIAIAVSLQSINQEMQAISQIFGIAIPGTLSLVLIGAWWLSETALTPVKQLTQTMQQIAVASLDRRVAAGTTDIEFQELIEVFNQMLERLERSFKQASRFSADAAHELKTPLAILQGELEQALQQATPGSQLQQTLGSLLDEVRRLSTIVRKLLLLSLADAGQIKIHKAAVNLSQLLAVMLEDVELLSPHLKVEASIKPNLTVEGDRDLLNQVLQNLMSNALKYNLPQGWLKLHTQRQEKWVEVRISNASPPIPQGDRDRLFDRFYRGDPARNRQVEGLGLGLSLCQEIVRVHNGSLKLETGKGQTTLILKLTAYLG